MVGPVLAAFPALLPEVTGATGGGAEAAAAGVLLLWLCLFGALGVLMFWGLPVAVAAVYADRQRQHPASALLWAGLLGWAGLAIFWYRGSAKPCPHCHTRIVTEAAHCYWCGGETRPAPLPESLRADGW
jgi:hypothetical protein